MMDEAEMNEHLMLTFIFEVNRFEEYLKKAGFKKPGVPIQADWEAFLSSIEEKFDPNGSAELQGVIAFFLDWDIKHPSGRRFNKSILRLLVDQIQEARYAATHGITFHAPTSSECDRMMAGLVVLAAWFDLIEGK